MIVRIDVTAEDIAHGVRGECDSCPIALAIERTLGVVPLVNRFDVALDGCDDDNAIDLPSEATFFIEDFDMGLTPEPFAFDLEVPA